MKKLILFLIGVFFLTCSEAQNSGKVKVLAVHVRSTWECSYCSKKIKTDICLPSVIYLEENDPLYGQIYLYYKLVIWETNNSFNRYYADECPVQRIGKHDPQRISGGKAVEEIEYFDPKWLEE